MQDELKVTDARTIRSKKRKPVETPDGVFVIRKLQVMDFVSGGSVLPLPALVPDRPGPPDDTLRMRIEEEVRKDLPKYLNVLLVKGVVEPRLSADPVPEDSDLLWIGDLEQATIDKLIEELNGFNSLGEGGATFQPGEPEVASPPPQDGESIREVPA